MVTRKKAQLICSLIIYFAASYLMSMFFEAEIIEICIIGSLFILGTHIGFVKE